MSFNGNEGAVIPLADAAALTKAYKDANSGDPNLILAHFVGINTLKQILDQPGCMGLRTYYALDANGKKKLVLVAADANENDITAVVLDKGVDCPISCGANNTLNS